jgi:hypothetical protein
MSTPSSVANRFNNLTFLELIMRKSISFMLSLAFVTASGAALAQSAATVNQATTSAQVTSLNSQTPVMSHEVASLMQTMQKAQAQYRKLVKAGLGTCGVNAPRVGQPWFRSSHSIRSSHGG